MPEISWPGRPPGADKRLPHPAMPTGPPTPVQIVERCLEAVAAFDDRGARECLPDTDFECTGRINSSTRADELVRYLELATPTLPRIDIQHAFGDGADVAHLLLVSTQLLEKFRVNAAQWACVRDGCITRLAVVFDTQW